jgi:hypothetical protein
LLIDNRDFLPGQAGSAEDVGELALQFRRAAGEEVARQVRLRISWMLTASGMPPAA